MTRRRLIPRLFCLLLLISLLASCTLPGIPARTPIPPTPTTYQQALPPTLIETDPPRGTVLGLQSPITFYFNQPMDRGSVESSFSGLPEGTLVWKDDSTLLFTPKQNYSPNSTLSTMLSNAARASNGLAFVEPVMIAFTVTDYLRATNVLPKADATDANVDAAIAVAFNQPVVSLGADPASQPSAFSLQPTVAGRGEWINTSTYVFYPDPPMTGGTMYTISLNSDLKSAAGSSLDGSGQNAWTFTTSTPRVLSFEPSSENPIPLDPEIKLTFNQPMDTKSVQSAFSFSGPQGKVNGTFAWNDDATVLTFKPASLLERGAGYLLGMGTAVRSRGGTALAKDYGAVLNTMGSFAVAKTDPPEGAMAQAFGGATFTFSTPLAKGDYDNAISVTPALTNLYVYVSDDHMNLSVMGDFQPETTYEVTLSGETADLWGQKLGEAFKLTFTKPPAPPALNLQVYNATTAFVRPDEPVLYGNATNVQNVDVTIAPISVQDYLYLQGDNSFERQQAFVPAGAQTYKQTFSLAPSRNEAIKLALAPSGTFLAPGLYYVRPMPLEPSEQFKNVYFAAASHVNLTFKLGATEALVWAVDLPSQTPIANAPVTIYDNQSTPLASGQTDAKGLWKGVLAVPVRTNEVYAVLGQPGDETFGFALADWGTGISGWDFGYSQYLQPPRLQIYFYTDRPIYRPGQRVYFRGAARQTFNGRYEMPQVNSIPLTLIDANGTQFTAFNMQLSPYGTFNGQFDLPADAPPGYYTISNQDYEFYFSFQVAEYRKPEIDLRVGFSTEEIKFGNPAQANINARYFFDAPAGNLSVHWALYTRPDSFYIPNYRTGLIDTDWLSAYRIPNVQFSDYFGRLIKEGDVQTSREGTLTFDLPAIPESDTGQLLTLEVTAQDESGLPVSARAELRVHPSDFYIGLHPDQWFGGADAELGFDVFTANWNRNASPDHALNAEFKQVTWEKQENPNGFAEYVPVYTPISSSNLATRSDGKARLSFIPPQAGIYALDVRGEGTRTQILIWVGGSDVAAWPDVPNQRLQLTADQETYTAGQTARVFIPNPFPTKSIALVTVERGSVSRAEVVQISGSGTTYKVDLTEEDAPNVYIGVTILGQGNQFRAGLVNLQVAPEAQSLNVQVSAPAKVDPGQNITLDVYVTDNKGRPVEGEFSVSMVDQAVLALADPNAEDILPAFYSAQPLGVSTGISVAAYSGRSTLLPGGLGGGGDGAPTILREDFPDTAYWNPSLITNSEGRGQVSISLPDSLTTWQVDVRGLTVDTRVGQADLDVITSKPLLVRPVTPRFLVSGDHVLLAAIVQNNTPNSLSVNVTLTADGFVLDQPDQAAQRIDVPANGRTRVEWQGTAGQAEAADLIFAAESQNPALKDATRPVWGKLPILAYVSPQTFVTGGVLRGQSTQQEIISLPRTFTPNGGGLDVELSPSLAGSLLSSLEAMEVPDYAGGNAESTLSYFLPNLELYRALQAAGLQDPVLTERVTENLDKSVRRLINLQNKDGGWSWWSPSPFTTEGNTSDVYISAYALFGLTRAREAGIVIENAVIQKARDYLADTRPYLDGTLLETGQLDRLAFIEFVLQGAGGADPQAVEALYNSRDQLSPWAKAMLALVLYNVNPADERARDLISNLESSAIRTATGAHWESASGNFYNPNTTLFTTAAVVYALAQRDPASQVVSDAARFLSAHRNAVGLWGAPYENAWIILALTEAVKGFGELQADFSFNASLNGGALTSGDVVGSNLTPVTAHTPLEYLSPTSPNLLTIGREDGLGRLYYHVALDVNRPVQTVQPLNQGMQIERVYIDANCSKGCPPLSTFSLSSDRRLKGRLTLTLPHDAYYVMVEDFIPAGTEILNRALKASQQADETTSVQVQYDDKDPFFEGWGWWLFHEPQIRDDSILWASDYLPAGTYVLTYTLVPVQAGEYRVLPARAWQAFFPEVQGTGAGMIFEIEP